VFADAVELATGASIIADGGSDNNGCGAGGSIWIRAGIMTGGGTLHARGGSTTTLARYGGGGRIALETGPNSTFDGLIDAQGGLLGGAHGGETGSIFRATAAVAGVYGGPSASPVALAADYEVNRSTAGVKVERTITQWGSRVFAWEDVSRDANGADLANAATYTLLGLDAGKKASVTVNGSPRGTLTVDAEGRLVIEDAAMEPAAAVRVELAAGGTLILLR